MKNTDNQNKIAKWVLIGNILLTIVTVNLVVKFIAGLVQTFPSGSMPMYILFTTLTLEAVNRLVWIGLVWIAFCYVGKASWKFWRIFLFVYGIFQLINIVSLIYSHSDSNFAVVVEIILILLTCVSYAIAFFSPSEKPV